MACKTTSVTKSAKDCGVLDEKYIQIRASLIEQLKLQNKTDDFYIDLVDDYMAHWYIKEMLISDIQTKGLRYRVKNGNGISSSKPNESVQNLQKETAIMLKILSDLKLREPELPPKDDDVSDYL